MTREERQRIKELRRLQRVEDKLHVKLSKREAKLEKSLKAVRLEFNAHMRRWRKLQNEIEKIGWRQSRGCVIPGPSMNMLERVKELRASTGMSLTEAVAKAKEEARQEAKVQP